MKVLFQLMSFDFYCCILPVQIARTTEPSIDYSTEYYDHDIILSNSGLIDNRQQSFGYFDHETLEVCLEVFTKILEKIGTHMAGKTCFNPVYD